MELYYALIPYKKNNWEMEKWTRTLFIWWDESIYIHSLGLLTASINLCLECWRNNYDNWYNHNPKLMALHLTWLKPWDENLENHLIWLDFWDENLEKNVLVHYVNMYVFIISILMITNFIYFLFKMLEHSLINKFLKVV